MLRTEDVGIGDCHEPHRTLSSHLLSSCLLLLIVVIDPTAVLRPPVTPLLVQCGWINMLKETVKQLTVVCLFGVIIDLHQRPYQHIFQCKRSLHTQDHTAKGHTQDHAATLQKHKAQVTQGSAAATDSMLSVEPDRITYAACTRTGVICQNAQETRCHLYSLSMPCLATADTVVSWRLVLTRSVSYAGFNHTRYPLKS